ncbi:hypothetical protein I79_008094 [Cricetulus griseus]|uniref:Uncharacterized protein n=1 Tax=Cricetulus griseus TaxID=10029 RepID=G3HC90_CRIGR|nr:hypothetical protein I79_008094 [Cricetulus griseus]
MCLTAVDLSWEENVPTQILIGETIGRKDSAVVFRPPACQETCKARARGHTGSLPETRQTHPWPRVKRTEKWQIKRQRCWFQQEFGEPQDMAYFVDYPLHAARASCPSGHCPEESGAWPAFSSLLHF